MVSNCNLSALQSKDIRGMNFADLTDIQDVIIQGETTQERLHSYLAQVKNPYCFRVGNTPVKISFSPTEIELSDKLEKFFISLKKS